ncbi:hypothetical protein NBRC111894_166 [Sporolactobacillus inulinus]|uniref:Uncharacterized protein n=1 Tax=Sporolactobacillus inulinus TaxID=2078 RepID=A0A4Y1Z6E5_9BACL|nr:hypothetical protein NBRC111894_166 [Sporolactobacillus inulinus]
MLKFLNKKSRGFLLNVTLLSHFNRDYSLFAVTSDGVNSALREV